VTELTVERTAPNVLTVTRRFSAPPALVWRAHMEPDLLRRWLLGPDGWSMTECVNEARPGGRIRYSWREDATGAAFTLTGEYRTVEPPHRCVHVERFHMPDPTPDNHVETRFEADASGGTRMIMTMTVDNAETMEAMIATGMTEGMEASYRRLETLGEMAP